jgi:hypothetical protein
MHSHLVTLARKSNFIITMVFIQSLELLLQLISFRVCRNYDSFHALDGALNITPLAALRLSLHLTERSQCLSRSCRGHINCP